MSIRIPYAAFSHRGFERHFSVGMPLPWPLTVIWSCYTTSVPEDYNVCFWMAPESFTGADYYGAAYGPGFAGGGLTQPWAISHSGVDTTTNSADVQTGRWYRQAFSAYQPGTGTKQLRYWYDLPLSNMISASPASNYYNTNGSTHRFRWGDSPWAPSEPLNGRIAWIKAWQGQLSDQEIFFESQYAWPVLNQHLGTLWGVWPLFGAAHFDSFAPGARKFHYNLDNSDKTLETEGDPPLRYDRFIPRVRYFLPLTVAGAQSIIVNQASETDAAQTIASAKVKAAAQAAETDAAQALTGLKAKAIGQATETDTAQAMTVSGAKTVAIGQASETDTAQALGSAKARAIGQATETDTAIGATAVKGLAVNQVIETDSAIALTVAKVKVIGQATETDTAQALLTAAMPGFLVASAHVMPTLAASTKVMPTLAGTPVIN